MVQDVPTFASYEEILGIERRQDFQRKILGTSMSLLTHAALILAIAIAGWLAKVRPTQAAGHPLRHEYFELARVAPPPATGQLWPVPVHPPTPSSPQGNAPVEREAQQIGTGNTAKTQDAALQLASNKMVKPQPVIEKPAAPAIDPRLISPPPPNSHQQEVASANQPSAEELKRVLESTLKVPIETPTAPTALPQTNDEHDMSLGIEGINLGIYRERLEVRIKRNWFAPTYTNQLNRRATITVYFDLYRDGRIKVTGSTSTGNRIMDRAAIYAVSNTSPFDPLPPAITLEKVPLYAIFNY